MRPSWCSNARQSTCHIVLCLLFCLWLPGVLLATGENGDQADLESVDVRAKEVEDAVSEDAEEVEQYNYFKCLLFIYLVSFPQHYTCPYISVKG